MHHADVRSQSATSRRRAGAGLAAVFALASVWLLVAAAPAPAASVTIGQLAPNPFTYEYVPPYYYYTYFPPAPSCNTPADYLQPSVTGGTHYVVPANGETITSWSTNASQGAGQTMTLKVFRQTAGSTYEVVGHDGPRALAEGTSSSGTVNTFSGLSLPVQPGDVIGLYPNNASTVNDACMFSSGGDSYLLSNSNLGDGSSASFSTASGNRLNVTAVVQLATPPPGSPNQFTLSVASSGTGHGTVQSSPAGIEACASSCSQAFDENTTVTLTAHPDVYSTFAGWSGGGCSGSGTCQVTIHADTSVTATFAAAGYGGGAGYGSEGGYGYGAPAAGGSAGPAPGSTAVRRCKKASGKKKHRKARCARRTRRVAGRARNEALGQTILTTTRGFTLYSLSAETNGRFICTDSGCLSAWHPLEVPAGVRPVGPVALGTVRRPDGGIQATYHGHPLYSFGGDTAPGQANGVGLMDVGTWGAVPVPPPKR